MCADGPWCVEKCRDVWRSAVMCGEGPWCVEGRVMMCGEEPWCVERRAVMCGVGLCQAGSYVFTSLFRLTTTLRLHSHRSTNSMFVLINRVYPCMHTRKDKRAKTVVLQTKQCSVRLLCILDRKVLVLFSFLSPCHGSNDGRTGKSCSLRASI